jgi:hypothetical protein
MFKSKTQVIEEIRNKYGSNSDIIKYKDHGVYTEKLTTEPVFLGGPTGFVYKPIYKSLADFDEMYKKFSEFVDELTNVFDVHKRQNICSIRIGCVETFIEQSYNFFGFGQSKLVYKMCYTESGTHYSYKTLQELVEALKTKFPDHIKYSGDIKIALKN